MGIVLVRVDNRLIHGQILEAWVPALRADCIVVANNQLAEIAFQKLLMASAVPKGIKVAIGTIEEMVQVLRSKELADLRVLLLFANPQDALQAHRFGVPFAELNLGNLHGGKNKKRLSCTVALNDDDIAQLQALENDGVKVVLQCVPSDRQRLWSKLI
jgi:mannose/fructose/N-acetylgalactosamine-specific phosphotransferase system component IIB